MRENQERRERWRAVLGLERWLDKPMAWLGLAWLVLLVLELTRGLAPPLQVTVTVIWIVFIADFALRLLLAPDRPRYLLRNWLTAVSLLVPALRVFRVLRAVRVLRVGRAFRGVRLVKVVASVNRAMRGLARSMRRRRLGYALIVTVVVIGAGAGGIYAFERDVAGSAIRTYLDAVWWTTMVMTTFGTDYWPRSVEGRVLCILLALYALGVFGYITASLATYFIGLDMGDDTDGRSLRAEIASLRRELSLLRERLPDE